MLCFNEHYVDCLKNNILFFIKSVDSGTYITFRVIDVHMKKVKKITIPKEVNIWKYYLYHAILSLLISWPLQNSR